MGDSSVPVVVDGETWAWQAAAYAAATARLTLSFLVFPQERCCLLDMWVAGTVHARTLWNGQAVPNHILGGSANMAEQKGRGRRGQTDPDSLPSPTAAV